MVDLDLSGNCSFNLLNKGLFEMLRNPKHTLSVFTLLSEMNSIFPFDAISYESGAAVASGAAGVVVARVHSLSYSPSLAFLTGRVTLSFKSAAL